MLPVTAQSAFYAIAKIYHIIRSLFFFPHHSSLPTLPPTSPPAFTPPKKNKKLHALCLPFISVHVPFCLSLTPVLRIPLIPPGPPTTTLPPLIILFNSLPDQPNRILHNIVSHPPTPKHNPLSIHNLLCIRPPTFPQVFLLIDCRVRICRVAVHVFDGDDVVRGG